jgi:hypothetical protein
MQDIKYSEIPKGFTGFYFAPSYEYEVVMLFSMILPYLKPPMCIKEASDKFPDCTVIRQDVDGPKEMRCEIEKNASDFDHDIKQCDILVCWENDWDNCPMEIIELKREIRKLPFPIVLKPDDYLHPSTKGNIELYFQAVRKKSCDEGFEEQKKLYSYLKALGLFVKPGNWTNDETYTFGAGPYSLGLVHSDSSIELYFYGPKYPNKALPDHLRETYRREAEKILHIDTKAKEWPKVGKLGTNLSFDKLKPLLDWVAQEIGPTKGH